MRLGDWKLIEWYWGKEPELFNLADDPGEQTNLATRHPDKAAELQGLLDDFRADTAAIMPAVNPDSAACRSIVGRAFRSLKDVAASLPWHDR